jgi:hypothetical protein
MLFNKLQQQQPATGLSASPTPKRIPGVIWSLLSPRTWDLDFHLRATHVAPAAAEFRSIAPPHSRLRSHLAPWPRHHSLLLLAEHRPALEALADMKLSTTAKSAAVPVVSQPRPAACTTARTASVQEAELYRLPCMGGRGKGGRDSAIYSRSRAIDLGEGERQGASLQRQLTARSAAVPCPCTGPDPCARAAFSSAASPRGRNMRAYPTNCSTLSR